MTIADHCLTVLSERSPRTPEELAAACVAAGVTAARNPVAGVKSALIPRQDEAPLLADGRYGFTRHLLDGRWFTTRCHVGDRLPPSFDTALLQRLIARSPLRLRDGRSVSTSAWGDGIRGPSGWLPEEEDALVAVRLLGHTLEVRPVDLDISAGSRGEDLAERLRIRVGSSRATRWWPAYEGEREHEVSKALLQLLAEDDEVLGSPVPPLSELLPDLTRRPTTQVTLTDPIEVRLPVPTRSALAARAQSAGIPLGTWLCERLDELAWDTGPDHRVPSRQDDEDWLYEPGDTWRHDGCCGRAG